MPGSGVRSTPGRLKGVPGGDPVRIARPTKRAGIQPHYTGSLRKKAEIGMAPNKHARKTNDLPKERY